jgi:hypothetical protein
MDFNLTEEQKQYLDTVQRFVGRDITPHILELEKGHRFPFDIIRKAWDLGILNLSIPESVKGYSIDLISTALIIRELAYGDSGIATSAMCNDLANVVIAMHGTDEQKQAFLSPFVERPLLASFCLTEPNAGSDNSGMTTLIRKDKNGKYLLTARSALSRMLHLPRSSPSSPRWARPPPPSSPVWSSRRWPSSRRRRRPGRRPAGRSHFPAGGGSRPGSPRTNWDSGSPTRRPSPSRMW